MTQIQLGPTVTPRANFIAEAQLPDGTPLDGDWEMLDDATAEPTAAQLDAVEGQPRVSWHVAELAPGEKRTYTLRRAEAPPEARGIDLHHQDESGRIVVYFGGLLQTIYHYGTPNYRPYFAPNTAP